MSPQEQHLLESLLFDPNVSRNRLFARFEAADAKRIHRIAKMLRSLRREMQTKETRHWTETTDDGHIRLHLHQPQISAKRQVILTPEQWSLLCREPD